MRPIVPRLPVLGLALMSVLSGTGCSPRASTHVAELSAAAGNDEQSVRAARAAQNEAIAAGDVDRIAEFWTDDVEIRRGLGVLVVGRAAYRQLFVRGATPDADVVYQRDPKTVSISTAWPLAFESGTWAGHMGGPTGPAVIGGSYSAQWVKRGGRWLIRGEVYVALMCAGQGCAFAAAP
jgi:ketosteroid isomerase-like protein